jgi:hypothetical protein
MDDKALLSVIILLAVSVWVGGLWLYARRRREQLRQAERERAQASGTSAVGPMRPAPAQREGASALRHWWHEVLRTYGKYPCYATFLVLPSDQEAIRYLTDFSKELDLLTGERCFLMALSSLGTWASGFDPRAWKIAAAQHAADGYSLRLAQVFDIRFSELPCLLLFEDIRSEKYVTVALKGLAQEQISGLLREVFALVSEAAEAGQSPLEALEANRQREHLRSVGKALISEIRTLAGKSFETAIEATITAFVK